jgi:hypothetical protein
MKRVRGKRGRSRVCVCVGGKMWITRGRERGREREKREGRGKRED